MTRLGRSLGTVPVSAGLTLLSACSSAPVSFYTLMPPPAVAPAPIHDPAFQITVEPVVIPAQVDRPQLVVRDGQGELVPVETRRWIAPLADELRDAWIADLQRRLAVPEVSDVRPDPHLPLYRIRVAVQRLDAMLGSRVTLQATWTVAAAGDDAQVATCRSAVSVAVADGYAAIAHGDQQAVAAVGGQIAAALLAVRAGQAGSACPDDALPPG